MTGKGARNKGASFERWVANQLKEVWPEAKRGIGQVRASDEVPDVQGTPFWIECKRKKVTNIQGAIAQARKETDGRPVCAVTKRDHEPVLVTVELALFLELIKEWSCGQSET